MCPSSLNVPSAWRYAYLLIAICAARMALYWGIDCIQVARVRDAGGEADRLAGVAFPTDGVSSLIAAILSFGASRIARI